MTESAGLDFLKKIYDLQKAPEVQRTAHRIKERTSVDPHPQHPDELIDTYLDRIARLIEHPEKTKRSRNIAFLEHRLTDQFVIDPDTIPSSYDADAVITAQRDSLSSWIDYLSSDDAKYPNWLKYWTLRSVLSMGKYDKQRHAFVERNFKQGKNITISSFPDLNQEALGFVLDAMEKKYSLDNPSQYRGEEIQFRDDVAPEDREALFNLLSQPKESFARLYGLALEQIKITPEALLKITDGEWKVYEQGSNPLDLVNAIKDYGTGWCIRGESYARRYLENNHLTVFFSNDQFGSPTVPRVVIVESPDGTITEVRGIAEQENLDPYIIGKVRQKLEGDYGTQTGFEQKLVDIQMLTAISQKIATGRQLTKEQLVFLYELKRPIEYFGYQKPKTDDLLKKRDLLQDTLIVFAPEGRSRLAPEEIARSEEDIRKANERDIKLYAYIGPLFPGIFTKLPPDIPIYESFPELPVRQMEVTIGGMTSTELQRKLNQRPFGLDGYGANIMNVPQFTTKKHQETIRLVQLSVASLGFPQGATTAGIYAKARSLGLDICPAEVGPHLRLQDTDQQAGDDYFIAIEQIPDSRGYPVIFCLVRGEDKFLLYAYWADPDYWLDSGRRFVFTLRTR